MKAGSTESRILLPLPPFCELPESRSRLTEFAPGTFGLEGFRVFMLSFGRVMHQGCNLIAGAGQRRGD